MSRSPRGMTLIELLIATALFALLSLMAAQMLSLGVVQSRGIARLDARQSALGEALTLLRADLEAAVALPLTPDAPAWEGGAGRGTWLRAGLPQQSGADGAALGSGIGRVVWRHDAAAERLLRQILPAYPTSEGATPEVAVLEGVRAFRLRPLGEAEVASALSAGFEAVIEIESGAVRVVVAL